MAATVDNLNVNVYSIGNIYLQERDRQFRPLIEAPAAAAYININMRDDDNFIRLDHNRYFLQTIHSGGDTFQQLFYFDCCVPLTTNTHVDLELSAISRFEMELFFLSILTTLSKKNRMGEKKRGRMEWNPFVCRRHVVKIVDSLPRIPAQPGNIGPSLISFVAGI